MCCREAEEEEGRRGGSSRRRRRRGAGREVRGVAPVRPRMAAALPGPPRVPAAGRRRLPRPGQSPALGSVKRPWPPTWWLVAGPVTPRPEGQETRRPRVRAGRRRAVWPRARETGGETPGPRGAQEGAGAPAGLGARPSGRSGPRTGRRRRPSPRPFRAPSLNFCDSQLLGE